MSMFEIYDGRPALWQWDLNRHLIVHNEECSEVHFYNGSTDKAPVCEVKTLGGKRVTEIPNLFLQECRSIIAYAYIKDEQGAYTKEAEVFEVLGKNKPEDYVYTETEVKSWDVLDKRIKELEQRNITADASATFAVKVIRDPMYDTATIDKTNKEIYDAYDSGKHVICEFNADGIPFILQPVYINSAGALFSGMHTNIMTTVHLLYDALEITDTEYVEKEAFEKTVTAIGEEFGQVVTAIDEELEKTVKTVNGVAPDENGNVEIEVPESGGGMNATASGLLITILRNGVYANDQSANITALEAALASGGESGGGESGGDETHTHSYIASVTKAATCETAGIRTYTCSCGHSYTEAIPATGHNYVSGVCANCGAADPNYAPSENNGWTNGEAYAIAWTDGYALDGATGAAKESSDFCLSNYLPCHGADSLTYGGVYAGYNCYFYDENKNYICKFHTQTYDEFPVPLNAYYARFIRRATQTAEDAYVIPHLLPVLNDSTPWESGVRYRLEWEYGKTLQTGTGAEKTTTSTTQNVSKYALCMGASTVTFAIKARSLCAFYDADKNYISDAIFGTTSACATVPENAVYFRYDTYGYVDEQNPYVELT